jgi:NADH dehydrogenase
LLEEAFGGRIKPMKKVAIIGCGFAGLAASIYFWRHAKDLDVHVFDRKPTFDFLPMLPDCLGRNISPEHLFFPIAFLSKIYGFDFINESVSGVDLQSNIVSTAERQVKFDYLLIASGSETNFYGNNQVEKLAYKLDSVQDAKDISKVLKANKFESFVISGAGYTGVEIATNLSVFFKSKKIEKKIIIVERNPSILGPLPEWMKAYAYENLRRLNVEILTQNTISKVEGNKIFISNGRIFDNSMLIWAAGVKTPDYVQALKLEKNPQGRLKVDEYLRIGRNSFVAGDCANFIHKNQALRMAVQFSIIQGSSAARNILADIKGAGLCKFSPIDLGFIVPMANNRSCGKVLGVNMRGRLATMFHFLMCIYRSYGARNRIGVINDLIVPTRHQ